MRYVLSFRSSVNRWECDENDHLNVRFYNRMVWECLHAGLPQLGIAGAYEVRSLHQRYLAEARLATPIAGYCALVEGAGSSCLILVELRNPMSESVLASFVCELDLQEQVEHASQPLPAHAGSRGIPTDAPSLYRQPLADIGDHGLVNIGRGVVRAEECGADGRLPFYAYMGRMSDAMPNLWGRMQTEAELAARSNGFQGGAVLEYRMVFHGVLSEGSAFEVWSGLRHVGEKIQHFEHLLYDSERGICVMSAQAIGVVLDLQTRRSVVIADDRRARMQALMIR